MRGEPGTTCALRALWWEGPMPEAGDFLRTRAGSCYRIDRVRETRPGSKSRCVLYCTRLPDRAVEDGAPGVWAWEFAPRG